MLGHRRRRRPIIKPTLGQRLQAAASTSKDNTSNVICRPYGCPMVVFDTGPRFVKHIRQGSQDDYKYWLCPQPGKHVEPMTGQCTRRWASTCPLTAGHEYIRFFSIFYQLFTYQLLISWLTPIVSILNNYYSIEVEHRISETQLQMTTTLKNDLSVKGSN